MPQDVVEGVDKIDQVQGMPWWLAFANRYGKQITNNENNSNSLLSKYNEDTVNFDINLKTMMWADIPVMKNQMHPQPMEMMMTKIMMTTPMD